MRDLEQEAKADVPWVDAVIVGAGPAGSLPRLSDNSLAAETGCE